MRRLGSGGMASALLLGLGAAVAAAGGADYDGQPSAPKGLLSDMFGEKPRPAAKKGNQAVEARPAPVRSTEAEDADQQRHMNALMRRMEVCDRLRMIALQTGNEALMNQANELEDRANEIYRRQTSRLPLNAPAPPSAADAGLNAASQPAEPKGAAINKERQEAPARLR